MALVRSTAGETGNGAPAASLDAAFAATPTAGHLLWCAVTARPDPTGGGVPTIAVASGGNPWTAVNAGGASDNHRTQIFYRVAGASEATTVTATPTLAGKTNFSISMEIFEHDDFTADGWTLDKQNSGSNTGSTSTIATGSTGTLSAASELVVSVGTVRTAAGTLTNDSSLTNGTNSTAHSRFVHRPGYLVVSATTALNVTWSNSGGAASAGAVIATFMAASAAPAFVGPRVVVGRQAVHRASRW